MVRKTIQQGNGDLDCGRQDEKQQETGWFVGGMWRDRGESIIRKFRES